MRDVTKKLEDFMDEGLLLLTPEAVKMLMEVCDSPLFSIDVRLILL